MRGGTRLIAGIAAGVLVMVAAAVGAVLATGAQPASHHGGGTSGRYGTAPAYTLTDQHGRPFRSTAARGRVQVVSYLFPYCTSYCPIIARTLAETERLADRQGLRGKVDFVAFNVDPGEAGPSVMSAFLRQEGINPNDQSWHFLTGTPAQVSRVVRNGFHVYYQKVTLAQEKRAEARQKRAGTYTPEPDEPNALATRAHVNYDIVHNDAIEVVDPHGVIRTFIDSGDKASPRQLDEAIRNALRD